MSRNFPGHPKPKRSLGQNFLVDQRYIDRIVAAVDPAPNDLILEIGPGRGAITEKIVNSGAHVVAIELDDNLIGPLTERFGGHINFQLFHADALTVDFAELILTKRSQVASIGPVKLVANLPYYISTAILESLAEHREVFHSLVLMFQREVVERIAAKPGNSDRGFLTVLTESAFEVRRLFDVPPIAFRPAPKVTSAVVQLAPKAHRAGSGPEFRKLLSTAFAQKRKTILNNLKSAYLNAEEALGLAGIDPKRRAESLSLDEWLQLDRFIKA